MGRLAADRITHLRDLLDEVRRPLPVRAHWARSCGGRPIYSVWPHGAVLYKQFACPGPEHCGCQDCDRWYYHRCWLSSTPDYRFDQRDDDWQNMELASWDSHAAVIVQNTS